jgi:Tfp pilus assembly protein PilN
MQAVNLLPKEAFANERSRINVALLGAGATPVIALALVIFGYSSAHSQVESEIAQLSILNSQVAELAPAKVREEAQYQAANASSSQLEAERTARLTALEGALATNAPIDTFLDQFARVLPSNVWLSTMDLPATSPGPAAFSITGFTYSQPAVAQLLARLQLLPSLSDITLASSAQTLVGTKYITGFSIDATVTAPTPVTTTPAIAPTAPASTTTTPTTAAP